MIFSAAITALSREFFYPLWDLYDRSSKLNEWRRLEKNQRAPLAAKHAEQLKKLKDLTATAAAHVPFYRERAGSPIVTFESLASWPIVTKADLQKGPAAFFSTQFSKDQLIEAKTGGSTGTALEVYFDKTTQEKRNAAQIFTNRWCGWELGEPVGALWGNPPATSSFKPWVRNALLDRMLFLDTVSMTEAAMAEFLRKIDSHRVQFLFGHSHSLFVLADYIFQNKIKTPSIRGIVSTSMMLLPNERERIEGVFKCKVIDRYGCEEVGLIATQCEMADGFHINIDHLVVEFLKEDGTPARAGENASIVVTDLNNFAMPLIRYAVGDGATVSDRVCTCGRSWPILEKITGRVADFLVKKDGSLVAGVSLVERTLTAIPGLAQMQIVQESVDRFVVHAVSDTEDIAAVKKKILSELHGVFGNGINIDVRFAGALPQEANGKYRFAICKVPSRYQRVAV